MLRISVIRHFDRHFNVCYTQVIMLQSLMLAADARAEGTGARPSRAVVARRTLKFESYSRSSTVFGPHQEAKKISLVTMPARCFFTHRARK
jgi:hypothetical protein